jgi:heparanase
MRAFLFLLAGGVPASTQQCSVISIDARLPIHVTAPYYATFNIDSSQDRSFFLLDWAAPQLVAAAGGLGRFSGSHIRFGGTGNNDLFYDVSGEPCALPANSSRKCLNATTWADVAALAAVARSPLIFGVNFFPFGRSPGNNTFDPTNAVQFFEYAHARGDAIWGVELGNELGPDSSMTAEEQATGLLALDAALAVVYGSSPRPFLVGPDTLGFHTPAPPPSATFVPSADILAYLTTFVRAMGGKLRAVTHHEYIEVNSSNILDPATLDLTAQIASQVVAAIRAVDPSVEIWAGEIGPHNGQGGPGDGRPANCGDNLICGRWGSTLWYADAMAAKAVAGYAAFCRQDLIGADYGLLNVSTLSPTPDYWLLVLWQMLVGHNVINSSPVPPADPRLRAYTFCGTTNGSATWVLVNLAENESLCVEPPLIQNVGSTRLEYILTPVDGPSGKGVTAAAAALNGVPLALLANGSLPALTGSPVSYSQIVTLPPLSVYIGTYPTDADGCGGPRPG